MNPPGSSNTLNDWLPWLETLSPREIVLGLDRVHTVLERLDLPRPSLVISVAGTNGKGSCAAMFDSLLGRGGMKTGCYTSPHLNFYNERIRIDGKPASDELIVTALAHIETVRGDVPLTFFEFGTLAALAAFASEGVDAWILEVGMGGRLDAVNAIEPDASLITSVSLDHCAWLGDDIESIATEKAGVMRASKPTIFGSPELPAAIPAVAMQLGTDLRVAGRDFRFEEHEDDAGQWSWQGRRIVRSGLRRPALSGRIQLQNAASVLAVLEALELDDLLAVDLVNDALSTVRLDGRFQIVDAQNRWILDVAHNPGASVVLADRLREQKFRGTVTAIVGMMADKDVAGFVAPLRDIVDTWIAVTVNGSRAESASVLARKIANESQKPCRIVESATVAFQQAENSAASNDVVLVTGSFYLVGPALEWLADRGQIVQTEGLATGQ